jgi:hypothetical protein
LSRLVGIRANFFAFASMPWGWLLKLHAAHVRLLDVPVGGRGQASDALLRAGVDEEGKDIGSDGQGDPPKP